MKSNGFDKKLIQFAGGPIVMVDVNLHTSSYNFREMNHNEKIERFNKNSDDYELYAEEVKNIQFDGSSNVKIRFRNDVERSYNKVDFYLDNPEYARHALKAGKLPDELADDPEFTDSLVDDEHEITRKSGGDDDLKHPIFAIKVDSREWYGTDFELTPITEKKRTCSKIIDEHDASGKQMRDVPDDETDRIDSLWFLEYEPDTTS